MTFKHHLSIAKRTFFYIFQKMKNNSLWLVIVASSMVVLLANNSDAEDVKKYYRAVVVRKNETAVLPCWELSDPTAILFWMSPEDVLIRSEDQHSSKYRVDPMDGSLTVHVSKLLNELISLLCM